jgi:hypothetical protein
MPGHTRRSCSSVSTSKSSFWKPRRCCSASRKRPAKIHLRILPKTSRATRNLRHQLPRGRPNSTMARVLRTPLLLHRQTCSNRILADRTAPGTRGTAAGRASLAPTNPRHLRTCSIVVACQRPVSAIIVNPATSVGHFRRVDRCPLVLAGIMKMRDWPLPSSSCRAVLVAPALQGPFQ